MRTLILNYHGMTEGGGGTGNLHQLPQRKFVEQLDHLKENRFNVISWRALFAAPRGQDGVRIAITFDDGYRSDLAGAQALKARGYDALFFIATEYIGQSAYMNRAEVRELHALGMGIGSHSHHHTLLAPMSEAQIERELTQSKAILEEVIQAPVRDFSFPGGSYDERVLRIGRSAGYERFYSSEWGVNSAAHLASGLVRRTSMLNNTSIAQFDALARLRNYNLRQAMFQTKELTKRVLGDERYFRFRRALFGLVR